MRLRIRTWPPVSSAPVESATFGLAPAAAARAEEAPRRAPAWRRRRSGHGFDPHLLHRKADLLGIAGIGNRRAEADGYRVGPAARPLPEVLPALKAEHAPPKPAQAHGDQRHARPLVDPQKAPLERLDLAGAGVRLLRGRCRPSRPGAGPLGQVRIASITDRLRLGRDGDHAHLADHPAEQTGAAGNADRPPGGSAEGRRTSAAVRRSN